MPSVQVCLQGPFFGSHWVAPHWGPPISTGEVPQGVPSSPWPHPGTSPAATSHRALQEPGRLGAVLFLSSFSGFYKERRKATPSARPGWKFIPGRIRLLLALVWWEALQLPWVPGAGSPKGEGILASPHCAVSPLFGTCHHCRALPGRKVTFAMATFVQDPLGPLNLIRARVPVPCGR